MEKCPKCKIILGEQADPCLCNETICVTCCECDETCGCECIDKVNA